MTEPAAPRHAAPHPAGATAGGRLLWADAAKGLTIFLVVLNHLVRRHYPDVGIAPDGALEHAWLVAMQTLDPIRMPLFFLLSGFFAASAVRRPWAASWVRRVARPYWLFTLWLILHAAFFTFESAFPATRIDSFPELVSQLVWPSSSLWFLFALAAYFAIAHLLRTLPRPGAALAVALAVAALGTHQVDPANPLVRNLPFFLLGAYAPGAVRAVAGAAGPGRLIGLVAAYAGLLLLATWTDGLVRVVAGPLLSLTGLAAAIVALVLGSRALPRLAGFAAGVGRTTLPVYVLHLPVMALLAIVVSTAELSLPAHLLAVYPLLATAAVVLVCQLAHRLSIAASLDWLFDLPAYTPTAWTSVLGVRAARARFAA